MNMNLHHRDPGKAKSQVYDPPEKESSISWRDGTGDDPSQGRSFSKTVFMSGFIPANPIFSHVFAPKTWWWNRNKWLFWIAINGLPRLSKVNQRFIREIPQPQRKKFNLWNLDLFSEPDIGWQHQRIIYAEEGLNLLQVWEVRAAACTLLR